MARQESASERKKRHVNNLRERFKTYSREATRKMGWMLKPDITSRQIALAIMPNDMLASYDRVMRYIGRDHITGETRLLFGARPENFDLQLVGGMLPNTIYVTDLSPAYELLWEYAEKLLYWSRIQGEIEWLVDTIIPKYGSAGLRELLPEIDIAVPREGYASVDGSYTFSSVKLSQPLLTRKVLRSAKEGLSQMALVDLKSISGLTTGWELRALPYEVPANLNPEWEIEHVEEEAEVPPAPWEGLVAK